MKLKMKMLDICHLIKFNDIKSWSYFKGCETFMNKMSVKWKLVFFLLVLVTTLDPLARPHRHRRKLNVHKTFRRRPGRLQSVLCTFDLRLCLQGTQCAGKIFEFPKIFFSENDILECAFYFSCIKNLTSMP